MSNIRKSFNFRNGLQVDDTKFIINSNGLVGIGSTIPTQSLDVGDNVKVHGTIETEYLTVNNTTTIPTANSNKIIVGVTSITSGIITATSSSGIVTYYGDGGNLINLPTSQWIDVNTGFGYTSIYAAGFVGVGTVDPRFVFQVAGNTDTSAEGFTGVGIQTGGHILAAGIVTAVYVTYAGVGYALTARPAVIIDPPTGIGSTIGIGTFIFNEIVTGETSGTTARVKEWTASTNVLEVSIVDGTFTPGEVIFGAESGAYYTLRTQNTDDLVSAFADNDTFESEGDAILDFSETNPFGMP